MIPFAKSKIEKTYAEFLEFLEFVTRHKSCPPNISSGINGIFEECGCAYRIIDNSVVPVSSQEMAEAVQRAFEDLDAYEGARAHLHASANFLSLGSFSASVRESIHAVESVAGRISPESQTLAPALSAISKNLDLHPALKNGFSALYGYTSDEQGVRHALVDGREAKVTEADALYMLGSCASFVSYLVAAVRRQA